MNRIKTSGKSGYRLKPTKSVSLNEVPPVLFAEVSKIGRRLVVDENFLKTQWTGR